MTSSEKEMKLQTRLFAIEHVLYNTLANVYLLCEFSREQIVSGHRATTEGRQHETIPGADPAQADMWLSEIERAVTLLQSHALQNWAEKRKKAGLPD
jgi:hypothetical protein